jgi:hypothetical protein
VPSRTIAVGADVAVAVPSSFVPATVTRNRRPTSADVTA